MKVLVTGASGFIGARLVRDLRAAGFEVRAAGRRSMRLEGVEWVDLPDVTHADWPNLCAGTDVVVHLAGIAHTRGVSDSMLRAVNEDAAIALALAMSREQRLIFVSSIRAAAAPSSAVEITDSTAPKPACNYGATKLAAEKAILRLRPESSIVRPVTVYGAGAKYNMRRLGELARRALPLPVGSFRAQRSYVSVENLCSAVVFVALNKVSGVFSVSDPDTASLRDLIVWYRDAVGAPPRLISLPGVVVRALRRVPAISALLRVAAEPLVARPSGLLSAGWRPVHASTRDGVRHWAVSEKNQK